ncbi:hypothetical protein HD554DRAFT_2014921 [Boletus coccyginus]|nr:hypothetical protein HD554DRAFT_2014921 [Boletus coccyginus]
MSDRAVGRPWTAREDQLLAAAVAAHGQADNWKAVALSVPGRSNKACRKASHLIRPPPDRSHCHTQRWLHSLSPSVKKTAWTSDEDNLLLDLFKIHPAKWALIARNIPGRTDDACSKRYREALDPALKKDDWTPNEDDQLIAAYNRLGGKWGRVGQELQRSGLGCRNRWRLLQRKRPASLSDQGPPASKSTPEPHPSSSSLNYSTPWPLPMIDPEPYWDDPLAHLDAPPSAPSSTHPTSRKSVDVTPPPVQHAQLISQLIDYPAPFHYSSSSLSSALSPQHAAHYEKDADATASNGRQSLLLPTAPVPSDATSTAVFAPFDYDSSSSSTCALSVGSTSPAPQATYAEDMHQTNIFNNPPHQFHQLQRTVPHTAIQVHSPSVHPVHVDHYTAPVAHEEFRRSTASPRSVGVPYTKRPSLDNEDHPPQSFRPIPRQKIGAASSTKRADPHAPLRLSSDLQATPDPAIKPYACGHESCWPSNTASSRASYCTSRGLSDHNKTAHPEDSGGDRPYRCGLEGCGKSWKSINGLQYHLQISKAHFQHAITSSYVSSYISGLAIPESVEASVSSEGEDKTKKLYKCPHENCPNRYKQLSGLRYHLAHGHPVDLPKQLDLVPPALSRKLAEKMRIQGQGQGSSPSSSEHQTRNNSSEASNHTSFHS